MIKSRRPRVLIDNRRKKECLFTHLRVSRKIPPLKECNKRPKVFSRLIRKGFRRYERSIQGNRRSVRKRDATYGPLSRNRLMQRRTEKRGTNSLFSRRHTKKLINWSRIKDVQKQGLDISMLVYARHGNLAQHGRVMRIIKNSQTRGLLRLRVDAQ